MDEYRQIGPEKGDYPQDVRAVARELRRSQVASVALTHRLTKNRLMLALGDAVGEISPVGGGVEATDDWIFVAVIEHGAYWFRLGGYDSPGYVAEKLGIEQADGETVAEFLGMLAVPLRLKEVAS